MSDISHTKGKLLCDSTDRRPLERSDSQTYREQDGGCQGLGMREWIVFHRDRVLVWEDE